MPNTRMRVHSDITLSVLNATEYLCVLFAPMDLSVVMIIHCNDCEPSPTKTSSAPKCARHLPCSSLASQDGACHMARLALGLCASKMHAPRRGRAQGRVAVH